MTIHSSILAWRISWTEEPGSVLEPQSQTLLKQLNTHSHTFHLYMDLLKDILVASTFLQLSIKHSCEGF